MVGSSTNGFTRAKGCIFFHEDVFFGLRLPPPERAAAAARVTRCTLGRRDVISVARIFARVQARTFVVAVVQRRVGGGHAGAPPGFPEKAGPDTVSHARLPSWSGRCSPYRGGA